MRRRLRLYLYFLILLSLLSVILTVRLLSNSPRTLSARTKTQEMAMSKITQVAVVTIEPRNGLRFFGNTDSTSTLMDVACSLLADGQALSTAILARKISPLPNGQKSVQFYDDVSSFGKLSVSFQSETLILLVAAPVDAPFDGKSKAVSLRFDFKPSGSSAASFFSIVSLRKIIPHTNFTDDATTQTLDSAVIDITNSEKSAQVGSVHTYTLFVTGVDEKRFPPVTGNFPRLNKIYEIGHRGCGKSYETDRAAVNSFVTENTIASFNYAAKSADFIELDVICSSRGDKVPFIYHDWYVAARTQLRESTQTQLVKHRTVEFTQSELAKLSLEHQYALTNATLSPADPTPADFNATDAQKHRFETLKQILEGTTPELGINVEIKYPILQTNGFLECDGFIDRNAYVDMILDVLEKDVKRREAAGLAPRRILITSFDPDTCALATLKQSRYPVAFLAPWFEYTDWRQIDAYSATAYASSMGLFGLVCDSRKLPSDKDKLREFVDTAKKANLHVWTWSALNMIAAERQKQMDAGIEGIIMDRIYTVNTTRVPE